jgi:quercetin dioxygenase-like cupin family protein
MRNKIILEMNEFKQIFPMGEKNDAYAQYFTGQSFLAVLTKDNVTSYNVTFEPGCRNNWHIHHKGGQILYCTAGTGWYQEEGKPARLMHPGDVVNIPAGVNHWHGATKGSWFSHIAHMVPAEGATTEWREPVADEEYNKL